MKAMARFSIALIALMAVTGWILAQAYTLPLERHAIWISATIVIVVQLISFALVVMTERHNAKLAGWGMGIALRTLVLILYGLFFAKLLGLPLAAALVSFAAFMFASLLLESFLIAYAR
ncbi:MAG TPA: hypothetical protein VF042_12155 [Gemmatimonadaceae bacterium]